MYFFQNLHKILGCIAPFSNIRKYEICKNITKRVLASDLRKKVSSANSCKHSCTYTSIEVRNVEEKKRGKQGSVLTLLFHEKIKKIESFYLYSGLSLLAEIGGYVGLFLGVSVVQITKIINFSMVGINSMWK